MIYLRETFHHGVALYTADETITSGTIIRVLKQNKTSYKKKLLHVNDTLTPYSGDMEFQTEEEAICWTCINEL